MFDIMGMGKSLGEGLEELNGHLKNIERFSAATLMYLASDNPRLNSIKGMDEALGLAQQAVASEPKGADDATA